ncbi:hypothetical protein HYC85_007167 [Camellia sinensis]|uniref:Uncharacterized protein n=1 Tax=Camellia sinensis TaxID=4442 RepID=A0A7J7HQ45_CAMSI|nr:hypothetical protein HYC85_007167 [Camellia sinensis]
MLALDPGLVRNQSKTPKENETNNQRLTQPNKHNSACLNSLELQTNPTPRSEPAHKPTTKYFNQ